jgi:drug/metabolite transporter (DMT)-like permease
VTGAPLSAEPTAPRRSSSAARPTSAATGLSRRLLGHACGLLSVVLFSGFTLASRRGLASSLTLPDLAALRFGIGGTLMLPVLLRYGFTGVRWRDAVALAGFGGIGFALLAYAGFSLAPATHGAVLLHGTLPLTTAVIMRIVAPTGTRYRPLGLALIAGGVAAMTYDSLLGVSPSQLAGDFLLLLASLSWSAYGVWARRLALPPQQAAAIVAVLSMACYLPVYALLPHGGLRSVAAPELLLQVFVQGILVGAVSIFVYTCAVTALGPATAALFTAAVPGVTTLAALPLLAEHPSVVSLVGVGTVTVGIAVSIRLHTADQVKPLPQRRDAAASGA